MSDSDYSFTQRLLHRVVLNDRISRSLFQMESSREYNRLEKWKPESSLFVAGLARSGTTALMRALHSTVKYATLTYADMPFVMAPNLWAGLAGRKVISGEMRERAHGDGIMVNLESPESFEEVFWRSIGSVHGVRYVKAGALVAHDVSPGLCGDYELLQRMVCCRYRRRHYLAKNNNHILRLPSLIRCLRPNVTVLLMIRDPLRQAYSLLRQHQRFSGVSRWDAQYMRWLGHYEFGDTHRPFSFGQSDFPLYGCPDDLDYWLSLWVRVYRSLLHNVLSDKECAVAVCPVVYEHICSDDAYRNKVYRVCRVMPESVRWRFEVKESPYRDKSLSVDPGVLAEARTIYAEFTSLSRSAVAPSVCR